MISSYIVGYDASSKSEFLSIDKKSKHFSFSIEENFEALKVYPSDRRSLLLVNSRHCKICLNRLQVIFKNILHALSSKIVKNQAIYIQIYWVLKISSWWFSDIFTLDHRPSFRNSSFSNKIFFLRLCKFTLINKILNVQY